MDQDKAKAILLKKALTEPQIIRIIECFLKKGSDFHLMGDKDELIDAAVRGLNLNFTIFEEHFPDLVKKCDEYYIEDKLIAQAQNAGINLDSLIERAVQAKLGV